MLNRMKNIHKRSILAVCDVLIYINEILLHILFLHMLRSLLNNNAVYPIDIFFYRATIAFTTPFECYKKFER